MERHTQNSKDGLLTPVRGRKPPSYPMRKEWMNCFQISDQISNHLKRSGWYPFGASFTTRMLISEDGIRRPTLLMIMPPVTGG